eukprot:CAMPEP_0119118626 /NCGR_PEP_ID=MMETSP1310-20130426/442_1 /TAXON_ID=464262 /ORGANISM="Genus nov. species nov., Strain RCC2339" /LENGTH=351 /DNA_ID=CAMNT_0007108013 /DNA_START=43 /DNA_END=1098 /DNA_ORIENTATION=+
MMMKFAVVAALFTACVVSYPTLDCPALTPTPRADNVTSLRPSDFKMLFAAGDSITAGFAMNGQPVEYRGLVYSIGAATNAVSVYNWLRPYTDVLVGGSEEHTLPLSAGGDPELFLNLQSGKTQLNGAVSGAKAEDVYHQVNYLAKEGQKKKFSDVDWNNDWKLFTLLIGANDLCGACYDRPDETPEAFGQTIESILDQIHDSIPRVAVQVVGLFNISQVWDINKNNVYCRTVDAVVDECGCLYDSKDTRQKMDEVTQQYNQVLNGIALDWQARNEQNFTVVYVPAFENSLLPNLDYLSGLDCFHPSEETDQLMATGIWNSMWTPGPFKPHSTEPNTTPICPTSDTILYMNT